MNINRDDNDRNIFSFFSCLNNNKLIKIIIYLFLLDYIYLMFN